MIARRPVLLPVLLTLACAACGTDEHPVERAATSSADASVTTGHPLPGDEALTPPPPDPQADEQADRVGNLPDGPLTADLELTVSGLTAFAEPVTGTCATTAGTPSVSLTLSDGSAFSVSFADQRGSALLTAPEIEVRQTLDAVALTVDGNSFSLAADLLTEGTTEHSGRLSLEGTCG